MKNEIKKGNCVLQLKDDKFSIIDPSGFIFQVDTDFSGSDSIIYSAKIGPTLFTGSTPLELLNNISNSIQMKTKVTKSSDYVKGYWDGVASSNKNSYDDGFDKGYKKAIGETIGFLISKSKDPLDVPEVQKLQSATYDGPDS